MPKPPLHQSAPSSQDPAQVPNSVAKAPGTVRTQHKPEPEPQEGLGTGYTTPPGHCALQPDPSRGDQGGSGSHRVSLTVQHTDTHTPHTQHTHTQSYNTHTHHTHSIHTHHTHTHTQSYNTHTYHIQSCNTHTPHTHHTHRRTHQTHTPHTHTVM